MQAIVKQPDTRANSHDQIPPRKAARNTSKRITAHGATQFSDTCLLGCREQRNRVAGTGQVTAADSCQRPAASSNLMRASERAGGVSCFAFAAATHTFSSEHKPLLIMSFLPPAGPVLRRGEGGPRNNHVLTRAAQGQVGVSILLQSLLSW